MDITQMLLYSSLMHMPGISLEEENKYWKNGISNLSQLREDRYLKDALFDDTHPDPILQSIENISNGKIDEIITELKKKSGRSDFYRVAYSYPEDVMFLDIETTGLSRTYHYITLIGWIINGSYNYWIPGMDDSVFLNTFKSAKMIVTFNGTKFDCPFLKKKFNDIEVTKKPNMDLMYLCKVFGLMHGQKKIEIQIGFDRPKEVAECDGKEAIVLWYKFLFGNDSALKDMIIYNFYDISGMMFILDYIFFENIYGNKFPKEGNPSRFFPMVNKESVSIDLSVAVVIRDYIKQNVSNFDMAKLASAMKYKVVGIDLAGVINKSSKTGICLLCGQSVSTDIVKDNKDIFDYIQKAEPDIVSIDAPLSLPHGRNTVYNDDPKRNTVGIMRFCERELKKRGVNVYPALIDSMQELTKRGIELSQELRKLGYPVIECFPGAAQDVLQLPRKRTDETMLKTGLSRLGIHGDFEGRKIYHDELDAITAALVGQFFIAEYYEPIGIMEENDLIIPRTEKIKPEYDAIIGVTGPISTGKTTTAKYFEKKGYAYSRYSQVIQTALEEEKKSVDRCSLQKAGWDLFSGKNQYELNKSLEKLVSGNNLVVIDGLRHYEDYTYWKERSFNRFFMLYVDTEYKLCSMRYKLLYPDGKYDEVVKHPVESEITGLKRYADFTVNNNGNLQELYTQLEKIAYNIMQSIEVT